jgi:hypothetical protein
VDECPEVALAALGVHVVFAHERVANGSHRRWLLQERPDARADIFESVVDAVSQIEEDPLFTKGRRENIGRHDDRCRIGNGFHEREGIPRQMERLQTRGKYTPRP